MRTLALVLIAFSVLAVASVAPIANAEPGGQCGSYPDNLHLGVDADCTFFAEHCVVWTAVKDACVLPSLP